MTQIRIENRQLTGEENNRMNAGFDELCLEEGVALESSERVSFVASREDKFIGCASGLAFKNGDLFSGWFLITDLYVEKEYRSDGLGTDLLRALETRVRTMGVSHLFLWTSGDKALRFYERNGYMKFAEMENWYSDESSRVGLRRDF